MGKPIHSRHDNGVPLKTALCARQIPLPVGIIRTAIRAVLRFFVALIEISG